MPISIIKAQAKQYALICIMLLGSWYLSTHFTEALDTSVLSSHHSGTLLVLFSTVVMFSFGFIIYELAKPTILPSFVLAIFFGIVSSDILKVVTQSPSALVTLITVGAVLILFDGGLDMPFTKFKNLLGPITSLAFIGTIINAYLLSLLIQAIAPSSGILISLPGCILLGAAVASTDPAAIIPCFKGLHFKKSRVKHIAIAESAINDVVGALLVTIFLGLFLSGIRPTSVTETYVSLLDIEHLTMILTVVAMGSLWGGIGFAILHYWSKWKEKVHTEEGTDAALFLAVPLFSFTMSEIFGGSGFLAVFLAGLLFHVRSHFKHVEHYFNHTIEGFMKPMIFMLLGAMVSPSTLLSVGWLGITMGLLTIFILRPLIVLITLTPFCFTKQEMTWKEMAFLCFVRETGVIPAALLITISVAGISGHEIITAVGLWIILLTLVIQPPLTPLLAKRLSIATDKSPLPPRHHSGPVAVLCSRGYSFPERIQTVVNWAQQHRVDNIVLLHCPEEKYTSSFVQDVEERAYTLFTSINAKFEDQGKKRINFEFLCGPGLLQENIESLIAQGDVSIIFVGSKMLDYRMEDVKRLEVPFFFMP